MYERILVAVDGSNTSNLALQEAITLAKDQHSMLRLLHFVDLTMAYSSVEAPTVIEYQNAQKVQGQKLLADCFASARAAGVEFDSKLDEALGVHIYDAYG
jgi:nucleotide-binding universal stress UspA family protein